MKKLQNVVMGDVVFHLFIVVYKYLKLFYQKKYYRCFDCHFIFMLVGIFLEWQTSEQRLWIKRLVLREQVLNNDCHIGF